MNNFKEWLSDQLRYILLLLAVALGIAAIIFGMKMYRAYSVRDNTQMQPTAEELSEGMEAITILTEEETENVSEAVMANETLAEDAT